MAEARIPFRAPKLQDNPTGWGPSSNSELFENTVYQPFSKADRLGKVADWTNTVYQDKRSQNRYQQYGTGSNAFSYKHEEDESSFSLVDFSKTASRNVKKFVPNNRRNNQNRNTGGGGGGGGGAGGSFSGNRNNNRRSNNNYRNAARGNTWSVEVQPDWTFLQEIDFLKLSSMQLTNVSEPEDLGLYGSLESYDAAYDRVTVKTEKPLQKANRVFHKVSAIDDPVIREISRSSGQIFSTETVVAALMNCTRSVLSFDVIVQKIGDKLFFYQRDNSDLDLYTVNETSPDPPQETGDGNINSPKKLAIEATYINQNFSQQVLKKGAAVALDNPNPFANAGEDVASAGYRYRSWNFGPDLNLVCRTEINALSGKKPTGGDSGDLEDSFINVKALNEYDSKAAGVPDWRQKLDVQKGAIFATELKNNLFKISRWCTEAFLSGVSQIKFGYVSRSAPRDNANHVILGASVHRPVELAGQIGLSMPRAWGIFRTIVDVCRKQPDGKYLLLKDPNKSSLLLYNIPQSTFEEEPSDDDDDKDGAFLHVSGMNE